VADVDFTFDTSGFLSQWRDKYEERTERHSENPRTMKNRGKVTDLKSIFIRDKSALKKGVEEKWISIFKQGRRPDGSPRKPKYMVNLDRIPPELIIRLDSD